MDRAKNTLFLKIKYLKSSQSDKGLQGFSFFHVMCRLPVSCSENPDSQGHK